MKLHAHPGRAHDVIWLQRHRADKTREAGLVNTAQNIYKMAMSRYTHGCRYKTQTDGQYVQPKHRQPTRYSVKRLGWNAQETQGKSRREG